MSSHPRLFVAAMRMRSRQRGLHQVTSAFALPSFSQSGANLPFLRQKQTPRWRTFSAVATPVEALDVHIDGTDCSNAPSWTTLGADGSSATAELSVPTSIPPILPRHDEKFRVTSKYFPSGDQPQAIARLVESVHTSSNKYSILRGVTGTGKTFVLSHLLAKTQKPTLVLCHNKTLAAQVARELRSFLSENAVELFVSYYNHYTPESFVETTGKYIEKKTSINEEIDSMRHRATKALLERKDVVIVASVSCIYGMGLPAEYLKASIRISVSNHYINENSEQPHDNIFTMESFVEALTRMLYQVPDNGDDMLRGHFLINDSAESITFWPPSEEHPIVVTFHRASSGTSGIESIRQKHANYSQMMSLDTLQIFPTKHHITNSEQLEEACLLIEDELADRLKELRSENKHIEADRLQQRVLNDLLVMRETGYCSGLENYSRHLAGRAAGQPPDTLMDYLGLAGGIRDDINKKSDWLLVIDESHVTVPQLKAMYAGDQARKRMLVKHGYRLPSALDNRPLRYEEFWDRVHQTVFVSATPSKLEYGLAQDTEPVDMIIRPTFVCDPIVHVRPPEQQLDDLLQEIQVRAQKQERVLAIALTKRDAEDLASYLRDRGTKAAHIHSSLSTIERADALKALQCGEIDCLVGVNLLREGLDLPQVSLVAILNADSEGFLRSETALLQIVGRAARNVNGEAIFYARRVTGSMQRCMDETAYRREKQLEYNKAHAKRSISTVGSDTLSIFDLLRDNNTNDKKEATFQTSHAVNGMPDHTDKINVDHFPSKPGVYFWKDCDGNYLYIGKAKNLRSRVKSYLVKNASHSSRIRAMLRKATNVDFIVTPSERDALVLESNLIKINQPSYNVLLKDDTSYPYICASIGDRFPRFYAVHRPMETNLMNSKYRYFGPYPHWNEINKVLFRIETQYDLRAKSFSARHGEGATAKEAMQAYVEEFEKALSEVFEQENNGALQEMRSEYEQASLLFDSEHNQCRDIVAVLQNETAEDLPEASTATVLGKNSNTGIVQVAQLRKGVVAGVYNYQCFLPDDGCTMEDWTVAVQKILEEQHYASAAEPPHGMTFFPDEILMNFPLAKSTEFKRLLRSLRKVAEPDRRGAIKIKLPSSRGKMKEIDVRAMEFALENAKFHSEQMAIAQNEQISLLKKGPAAASSLDGRAAKELASLLNLSHPPSRIECFDISHTQGEATSASRVVFVDGNPYPEHYRSFNTKTVNGVDDFASMREVLERRFSHASLNRNDRSDIISEDDDAWRLPDLVVIDGGKGQLSAAIEGMEASGFSPSNYEGDYQDLTDGMLVEVVSNGNTVVPIVALAKNLEEVFVPGGSSPLETKSDSPALLLLRAIRDESHRFALKRHRRRRRANTGL